MSDCKHIGDLAAGVRERAAQHFESAVPDNVVSLDTLKKARLARLAHEVEELIDANRENNKAIKAKMGEMESLSPNYANEFLAVIGRKLTGGAA